MFVKFTISIWTLRRQDLIRFVSLAVHNDLANAFQSPLDIQEIFKQK